MSLHRRTVLLGLVGTAVTGCAAPGSAFFQVLDSYRTIDKAKKNYPVTREMVDGQPLGVLGVQVEDGLKGFAIWQKREAGCDYWQSGNGVLLVTQAGRLIRTSGFPQDQLASRLTAGTEALGNPLVPTQRYSFSRELDYLPDQYGLQANYALEYRRDTQVTMLSRQFDVAEWSETVRLPKLRRQWKQVVQVDRSSGEVIRSIQHIGPKLRVILELLKAPVITAAAA